MALVSFLARSKPKVSFLGISLPQNQTETLATQATLEPLKGTSGLNNLQTRRGTAVKERPNFNFLLFNFELGVSRWFTDYSHRRYIVVERWPQLKEGRSRERRKLGLDDSHVLLLINGWTNGDFFLHFREFT